VFYFKDTVEYFTPVITHDYRHQQPLSLIIFEAMKDSINRGIKKWNWGGTWGTQEGVYRFKSRWGAKDFPYQYHIHYRPEAKLLTRNEVMDHYAFFYYLPYDLLAPAQVDKMEMNNQVQE
jgi:lipid II:glycine glycyltransferase (peptidoglycan interpeptide bridge formation enzyme)